MDEVRDLGTLSYPEKLRRLGAGDPDTEFLPEMELALLTGLLPALLGVLLTGRLPDEYFLSVLDFLSVSAN